RCVPANESDGRHRVKLAIVLPAYRADGINLLGGGERYAVQLASSLRRHADVTLVTFGPRFQRREHDGIRHVILRALAPSVENPVPLTSFFLRERFDLVHAFQLRAASTSWLTLWCRARRTPLVVVAGQVADARYLRDLEARAKGASVRFMISPSDDELLQEYGESAVTVSASVYRDMYGREWPQSELLGLTLLESMAVGTPVVCTLVGGMPEHVQDGVTGFIVPPNDPATLRG